MILGVGLDVVNIERFVAHVTDALSARLFTAAERASADRDETLAGWFAAKESLVKAFGGVAGFSWHDMQLERDDSGRPRLVLSGAIELLAAQRGVTTVHLSISHDAPVAAATVILEGGTA